MITGRVSEDYEAIIRLKIQSPSGQRREEDAVVDTGFNGFLTMPHSLIADLELTRRSRGRVGLADGSAEVLDIYGVTVVWDGQPKDTETYATGTIPLVGMALIDGYDLHVQVAVGGSVTIVASR